MSLENIDIPVNARKRELLEARFFDSRVSCWRSTQIKYASRTINNHYTASVPMLCNCVQGIMQGLPPPTAIQQTDSNLSAGSHHSSAGSDDLPPPQVWHFMQRSFVLSSTFSHSYNFCNSLYSWWFVLFCEILQTPEKNRTPSGNERKRKRKNAPVDHNDNSGVCMCTATAVLQWCFEL